MRHKTPFVPMRVIPVVLCAVFVLVFTGWLIRQPGKPLAMRVPGADASPGGTGGSSTNPVMLGKVAPGLGRPADLPGSWLQFRGTARDGLADDARIARSWNASGPRELWSTAVGDGYAGPVIKSGRVYLMDYDVTNRQDSLRCLALSDGLDIWRFSYPIVIKRNHGMSRTVPAVTEKHVVAIGPKCHVICCDPVTGELRWSLDLVREFGATVPEWYTGQCPLVDGNRVILAPGGPNALLAAADLDTGKILWQTPNPQGWKMTHSSVMAVDFAGRRLFVYCANKGVVGVSAEDGAVLWQTTDWKISIATVPSPCVMEGGKLFLSGGYNAGSMMMQLVEEGGGISPRMQFKLGAEVFGATQHSPVFFNGHIYGIRADGKVVCLTSNGKVAWTSGAGDNLGLGPLLLTSGGLAFAMNDSGQLRLIEATPARYSELARAQVLKNARESWGPMALAGGRLLVRDLTRLVCLDVGEGR